MEWPARVDRAETGRLKTAPNCGPRGEQSQLSPVYPGTSGRHPLSGPQDPSLPEAGDLEAVWGGATAYAPPHHPHSHLAADRGEGEGKGEKGRSGEGRRKERPPPALVCAKTAPRDLLTQQNQQLMSQKVLSRSD